jgi:hypothetical protein
MPDGSTLIALSEIYPGKRFAVLHSITRSCEPNPAFGNNGVSRIDVPADLRPTHTGRLGIPAGGVWIDTITPRQGGGAIISGNFGGEWLIGEVTGRGRMDSTFGDRGWVLLPFPGDVTAIVQQPSGRIVIAGDNDGGGCCTLNWAAALSARGRFEPTFGKHGREQLPTGEDSGVSSLALEPNGDILANIGYGNMGCWGIELAMLTPLGQPVPLFANRLARFWRKLDLGAFLGDVFVDGDGFTVIGTGQRPCDDGLYAHRPPAHGVIGRFRTDGQLVGRLVRFPSRIESVSAFKHGGDAFLVTSLPLADLPDYVVTARRLDGSVDSRFGRHGRVQIPAPWQGRSAANATTVAMSSAPDGEITVLAWRDGLYQLRLIRLRV